MPGPVGNNQYVTQDAYGHTIALAGPSLAAGGTATATGAGTISVNATGAGTGGSLGFGTGQVATDMAGTFTVTTSGTPAAGTIAVVTFANSLAAIPKAVNAQYFDVTGGTAAGVLGISGLTVNGFSLVAPTGLTTAHAINCTYEVTP